MNVNDNPGTPMLQSIKRSIRNFQRKQALSWFRSQCEQDPYRVTFWLFHSFYISSTVATLADRGLPDLLKSGPKTSGELAEGTGLRADRLERLLCAMANVGLFERMRDGRYGLTPYTRLLCTDHPDSLLPWARWCGRLLVPDLQHVPQSLETGENLYEAGHGEPVWEYLTRNLELGNVFDQGMAAFTAKHVSAILDAFDFSQYPKVMDVGGGRGRLISGILGAHPGVRGTLLDRAPVIEEAKGILTEAGVSDRCECIAGDFFAPLPDAEGAVIIKHVLHDWDDENVVKILSNISRSLGDHDLLIIEGVIRHDGGEGDIFRTWWDIAQMLHTRGRERSHQDWLDLLRRSGLRLVDITETCLVDVAILRVRRAAS